MSTVAAAYVKSQLRTKKSASALLLLLLLLPVHISEVGRVGGGLGGEEGGRTLPQFPQVQNGTEQASPRN